VVGILNLTKDSFYSGSRASDSEDILTRVETMLEEGMDILDIGAASSRPGAPILSTEEELSRLIPVLEIIVKSFPDLPISVDTLHWKVAENAISAGAAMINDISGGTYDDDMLVGVSGHNVAYCCMHMKGTPSTMISMAEYQDVLTEVIAYFTERVARCSALGITDLILDPGFGFAKTSEHNYHLLRNLEHICSLGLPVLAGISRKRMIYGNLKSRPVEALNGTSALHMLALEKGASILRVHDVKEAKECVTLFKLYQGET
jgi:dihydropteroate synthase